MGTRATTAAPAATASVEERSSTEPTFAAEVGVRVGMVIASLVARKRRTLGYHLGEVLLAATNAAFEERPMQRQAKAARQRVAGLAAVYYRNFLPPADWVFLGAELPLRGGRVDLAWELPDRRVIVDELKAVGYSDRLLLPETRVQVERYLAAGAERWGGRFAGMRLIALGAPYHSLYVPNLRDRVALADTAFFFGAAPVAA